jgi:hypothetical protein
VLFAAQCEKLFSKYSELQQNFSKYLSLSFCKISLSTKDTKKPYRLNMKRGRGEPARGEPEKLSRYDAWNLADGLLPKRRKRWEVLPYTPMRVTSDGKPIMDMERDMMELGEELVTLRDQSKNDRETIRTQHTQHKKLSQDFLLRCDQFWKQNAELVALNQNMNVMKENAVNDTATIKHLRAEIAKGTATIKCLNNSIAIHKRWELSTEKQIEDMKLELIECKKNKRTPTEMQHAELQRLKKVHDASRAPVTDEEKQEVLKAVEAADATETQQELEAAGISCNVCGTASNFVSVPCCNHVQELCTQCYAKAPIRKCPYCRGSLDTWTDRHAYAPGDQPRMLD